MSGCDHYSDDGRWPVAGMRATCGNCRRSITYVVRATATYGYWQASGRLGLPLPKSRRCTSRCPARGYLTCNMVRNHGGTCHAGGFSWWRGKGHSRPLLVGRPAWEPA